MGGCRARSGCSSCTYAAAYKAYTPDTICHCPCRYPDTQIPRYPRYPVRRMAKQSRQEVHSQEGRVPSNAFVRESSTSQENQIYSNIVGKPGTNLDSNGPLASTFRLYCQLLTLPWMPRWDPFGSPMRPSTG